MLNNNSSDSRAWAQTILVSEDFLEALRSGVFENGRLGGGRGLLLCSQIPFPK